MKNAGRGIMGALLLLSACIFSGMAPKPQPHQPLLLIAPAQAAILQAAFDVRSLRPELSLYAYRPVRGDLPPLLYAWESDDWLELDDPRLQERVRLAGSETRVVFVRLPPFEADSLVRSLSRVRPDLELIAAESVADLLNGLDPWCGFRPREWEWLAARQRLSLLDHNSPQREYNPYAIRRSELPLELDVFDPDPEGLPPAVIDLPPEDGNDG